MSDQVVVTRRLKAPVDRVFDAWTQIEFLKLWFLPESCTLEEAIADARVGGKYRIAMVDADDRYVVFGEYKRMERPTLVEFTWQWEESANEKGVSLVTVEMKPDGPHTDLRIIHTNLSSRKSREMHAHGWNSVLNRLTKHLEN